MCCYMCPFFEWLYSFLCILKVLLYAWTYICFIHNRDLLQPADEVAEDVLEAYQGESKGNEQEEEQSGELDIEDGELIII